VTRSARLSRAAIIAQLKLAARKGDRVALTLAIDQMKTLAYSPRYWQKYWQLLAHPLARLVDLTVIKQGEKIARQKGWVTPPRPPAKSSARRRAAGRRPRPSTPSQPSLFPDLTA
jgi:hypothetical protein